MRTAFGIQALLCHPQPLDRPSANQVFLDNGDRIFGLHAAVPNRIWINHDHRTMLALIQTPGLVDPHRRPQPGGLCELLQPCVQLTLSIHGARRPRSIGGPGVVANKNMALK
jgi:hypothetical protein